MDSTAAERMRRMRARKAAAKSAAEPLIFERNDWELLINPHTWPQRAGCDPTQLGRVIIKELVENALDTNAKTVLLLGDYDNGVGSESCTVTDDGPGLDPDQIVRFFGVNRPLLSSKLKRLPTRGMLGHGLRVVMGAVAAYQGRIILTSRGHTLELGVCSTTGATKVIASDRVMALPGTTIEIIFRGLVFKRDDFILGRTTIGLAAGVTYEGFSRPSWYAAEDLHRLLAAAPETASVGEVVSEVFGGDCNDRRLARSLDESDARALHRDLIRRAEEPIDTIGSLGNIFGGYYHKVEGVTDIGGAAIPYCVEAAADCEYIERDQSARADVPLFINRGVSLGRLIYSADSEGLYLGGGCGLNIVVAGAKRASYHIRISLIAPYIRLMNDGKTPYLGTFEPAIKKAVAKVTVKAYREMLRPPTETSIKDAAYAAMKDAYLRASDNGELPAKARQIMYAARGRILEETGAKKFSDTYFTQVLLPDYMAENPEETADWDVVYDARGHLTEPHTGLSVPLGTIQVRTYLGDRPPLGPAVSIATSSLYPTSGPENRYRNVLFVEKEGFDELFQAVSLAERFDLAIMSTKGMSVIAARTLLDRIANEVDTVYVLHDFDVSGFSICGTLGSDSRRYTFGNVVNIVPIGLRLEDLTDELRENAEPVKVKDRDARRLKLAEHGATREEIAFLATPDEDGMCRRVELNAMTSRQLVDLIEMKLRQNGARKVMPVNGALEDHARRVLTAKLTAELVDEHRASIGARAAAISLQRDLATQVEQTMDENPALSWDAALISLLDQLPLG